MKAVICVAGAAMFVLGACAAQKMLTATGGSRSDGVVELSYEFGIFEQPQLDLVGGQTTARQRCSAWGYPDAEAFGGEKRMCQQAGAYGNCIRWFVTVSYQCTGNIAQPAR